MNNTPFTKTRIKMLQATLEQEKTNAEAIIASSQETIERQQNKLKTELQELDADSEYKGEEREYRAKYIRMNAELYIIQQQSEIEKQQKKLDYINAHLQTLSQ